MVSFVCQAAPASANQKLYIDNCSACHQINGSGIAGAFPALAKTPFVQSDPAKVASVLLYGRNNMMPAQKDALSDAQIASILTYVRKSWGNKASGITASQVAAVRKRGRPF
nr:cytochrome c [Aquisediminimonas sediminicola]